MLLQLCYLIKIDVDKGNCSTKMEFQGLLERTCGVAALGHFLVHLFWYVRSSSSILPTGV